MIGIFSQGKTTRAGLIRKDDTTRAAELTLFVLKHRFSTMLSRLQQSEPLNEPPIRYFSGVYQAILRVAPLLLGMILCDEVNYFDVEVNQEMLLAPR